MLPIIKLAAPKVEDTFDLTCMVLCKEDIKVLFSGCNSKQLHISSCTMNIGSAPDLSSISKSSIEELWFSYIRSEVQPHSDWYKLLFQGIAKSEGIRHSLKKISIQDYKSKEDDVNSMKYYVKKMGMDKVDVEIKWYEDIKN